MKLINYPHRGSGLKAKVIKKNAGIREDIEEDIKSLDKKIKTAKGARDKALEGAKRTKEYIEAADQRAYQIESKEKEKRPYTTLDKTSGKSAVLSEKPPALKTDYKVLEMIEKIPKSKQSKISRLYDVVLNTGDQRKLDLFKQKVKALIGG
jgi:hypothetical protein